MWLLHCCFEPFAHLRVRFFVFLRAKNEIRLGTGRFDRALFAVPRAKKTIGVASSTSSQRGSLRLMRSRLRRVGSIKSSGGVVSGRAQLVAKFHAKMEEERLLAERVDAKKSAQDSSSAK